MMKSLRRLLVVVLSFIGTACVAPQHTVKPLPNFVDVALEPGDVVTVTTNSGEEIEFEIEEIRGGELIGEQQSFRLRELASIKKHAWSRPASPCGGEKPLGCSLPILVSMTSELHSHYEDAFYDACAQHDYCYRHGSATYSLDREQCDDEFLVDMQTLCPDPAAGRFGKVFEMLDGSVESRNSCLSVADDFYAAVKRYGEKRFATTNSTYCEYNGPP